MQPVTIYTKAWCPYCAAAKTLLKSKDVAFIEIEITGNADERRRMIERSGGGSTVPQIFIGEQHVGGSDDLHALERRGALDPLLAA